MAVVTENACTGVRVVGVVSTHAKAHARAHAKARAVALVQEVALVAVRGCAPEAVRMQVFDTAGII